MPVRLRVLDARPEPPVRGERLLAGGDRVVALLDRVLTHRLSPLAHSGAAACVTLIIAVVSGVPLLFWYSPSSQAHASLEALPWIGELTRSLHRYSSDACMLFTGLHLVRMLLARRVTGARWLAWVTGVVLLAVLWLVGWLGYWLVWDDAARQVALGTARVADALPIFADPLGRSLLSDGTVKPLLFFVVLFAHMLLPLVMGVALWLHLARLARARYLTSPPLTLGLGAALLALAVILPARSGAAAHMSVIPERLTIDAWYLAPLWLTERLGGGGLWAVLLGVGGLALALPWLLGRRRAPVAAVIESRCNACARCVADCPFGAIRMVPRRDGRAFSSVARVDAARCVGCGVCTGACDPGGIGVPGHDLDLVRRALDGWLAAAPGAAVAFLCARSAGAGLEVDPDTGMCDGLPGYRVMPVPCTGWVHPLLIERVLRHGAGGVLIVGCGPVEPAARDGGELLSLRLAGHREPALRADKLLDARVRHVQLSSVEGGALRATAAAFLDGREVSAPPRPGRALALGTAALLTALVAGLSRAPLAVADPGPELVVTFKHPGRSGEHCRTRSAEELARLPVHMRQPRVCERGRAPVRLRVTIDGALALTRVYAPRGLFGDGNSVAAARLPLAPGAHQVTVQIGDSLDPDEWSFHDGRSVTAAPRRPVVVSFDRSTGFRWE